MTQGCIFDQKLLYDKFPNEYVPFDFDTYFSSPSTFEMVTTNCLTGLPAYLTELQNKQRALDIVRASSSLPFVSKIVEIDQIPMLDGGITDSIPVIRSMETGHHKNVVILTRHKGYRSSERDRKIPHFIYKKYPRLRVALSRRVAAYNEQLELVDQLEAAGQIVCIRPQDPVEVGRMEKDTAKLERLYQEGYMLGDDFCQSQIS